MDVTEQKSWTVSISFLHLCGSFVSFNVRFCFNRRAIMYFGFSVHCIWRATWESKSVLQDPEGDVFKMAVSVWARRRSYFQSGYSAGWIPSAVLTSLSLTCLHVPGTWQAKPSAGSLRSQFSSLSGPAKGSRGHSLWFRGYRLLQHWEDLPFWHSACNHQSNKLLPDRH